MTVHGNPLRSEDVRMKNEKIILHAIQQSSQISQSRIVKLTGLKAPTVLRIFTYLEEQGLIMLADFTEGGSERKGRRPVYYQVNPQAHYVIGIEMYSKEISIVVVDFAKQPVYSKNVSDAGFRDADELFAMVCTLIREALSTLGLDRKQVLGIGVGAPGRVKVSNGEIIFYARVRNLENYPMGSMLEEEFSLPVQVNNNASVVALNAYRRGLAGESQSLLTFLIRTGVGGGYIYHGKLMTPQERTAVELGHISPDRNGRPCGCGAQGCIESYLSEVALLEDAASELKTASLEELDELVGQQDPKAAAFIEERGRYLALGARDLYRLFAPDTMLIITRYKHIAESYAKTVYDLLKNDAFLHKEQGLLVLPGVYDPLEACRGAADLIFASYFMQEV